jgi:hypothetical protein
MSTYPVAHNGLVAGSSPAGPTSDYNRLSGLISPQRDHRTRNRTRNVRFSFTGRVAHADLLDGIRQIIGVMMAVGVEQNLKRHSKIAGRLPRVRASLHQPRRRMRCASGAIAWILQRPNGRRFCLRCKLKNYCARCDAIRAAGWAIATIGIVQRRGRQLQSCSVLQRAIWTFSLSVPRATLAAR